MRILVVSNLFPPDYDGGQEINAWKIARALRDRGHEVDVVTSKLRPGFKLSEPEPTWVYRLLDFIPHIPDRKVGKAARFEIMKKLADRVKVGGPNSAAVANHLREHKYDLMYCFGLHGVGLATAYPARGAGVPVLWHCGDHFIADHFAQVHISRLYRFVLEKLLKPWFDKEKAVDYRHMAFVSQFLLDHFRGKGFNPENAYIVPRGVDFTLGEDIDRPRTDPPTFLLACRLDRTKGVHHALEAARQLRERRPELQWAVSIVGSGIPEYIEELKDFVRAHKLEDRVNFIGKLTREETLAQLRSATAFLSCSIWGEPFANTIIETLGSGTPLIGAEAGSILEVVQSEVSALTYERESPDQLSRLMERILDDPMLAKKLAENGLQTIRERYTMDRIMNLTEEVFQKVIA